MTQKLRYILFPIGILYAIVTEIRNFLFDKNILKSKSFQIPIINVGNLSIGGTGKTPQIEYLIRLLKDEYKVAVLSRGYKRKTKGFIVADKQSTSDEIGDEPYQIYRKFKNIMVFVGEKRVPAISKIIKQYNPDIILLDDAYQHRAVKPGLNIVLTAFAKPFNKDFILPVGDLRECRHQIKRTDLILISKTPHEIKKEQKEKIKKNIENKYNKKVFFSKIVYDDNVYSSNNKISINNLQDYKVLLITGIAKTQELYSFLSKKSINFESLKFGDHHNFTEVDLKLINRKFEKIKADKKLVLTTEKDYVRWANKNNLPVYYLPIQTEIEEKELFNKKILNYAQK